MKQCQRLRCLLNVYQSITPAVRRLFWVSVIVNVPFMWHAGAPSRFQDALVTIGFMGILSAPFILLMVVDRWGVSLSFQRQWLVMLGVLAQVAGFYALYWAYFLHAHEQHGLFLLLVPAFQAAFFVASMIGLRFLKRFV